MSFKIYIPTYRRTHAQVTLRYLSPRLRQHTLLVCVEQEADALRRLGAPVLVQPPEITTITAKRQWIVDQHKGDKLFMLDDDLRLCVRDPVHGRGRYKGGKPDGEDIGVRLNTARPEDAERMFKEWLRQLDLYAHAGISARAGNQGRTPQWWENKRMMYALGYNVAPLRKYGGRFDDIGHREDMYVALRLLTSGHRNSVSYEFAVDQVYNKAGGESAAGRKVENSNADAEKLAALFPQFVKTVAKAYKVSVPRIEVNVQWNKAFNQVFET